MTTMNTIVVPCIVNSALNVPASTKVLSGPASWIRMRSASMPPTRKKKNAVVP